MDELEITQPPPRISSYGGLCQCTDHYTIETHGHGWALYFGRCNHKHGYNLANIMEPDMPRLKRMLAALNGVIDAMKGLDNDKRDAR